MSRVQTLADALGSCTSKAMQDPRWKDMQPAERRMLVAEMIDRALTKAEPPVYRMTFTGPQVPADMQAALAEVVMAIKRDRIGAAVPLRKLEATMEIAADMSQDPPVITGVALTRLERW